MRSILIHIARLNLCRSLWHKLNSKYSYHECYAAFVEAMNAQAQEWGLSNTKWINPSGLGVNVVYSQSTANDLAIMAQHVLSKKGIKYHGQDGYYISIKKPYLIPGHRFNKKKTIYSTTRI